MKQGMKGLLTVLGAVLCLASPALEVRAGVDVSGLTSTRNASFVTRTTDGHGWTIDEALPEKIKADDTADYAFWWEKGTTVSTGVSEQLPVAGTGQHLYAYDRMGVVPVSRWEVIWKKGRCIHEPMEEWHGVYGNEICCTMAYYSGWNGYCADCGKQLAPFFIYANRDTLRKLQAVDTSQGYYYQCPWRDCRHIEQALDYYTHECSGVSYNQYRVLYDPNNGVTGVSGNVNPTYHMYNNAEEYRGEPAYSCSKYLSDNTYGFTMTGYKVIGWDREPGDPYGTPDYTIGQEISNLSSDDWNVGEAEGTGKGTITLYAVWGKVEAELTVKPGTAAEIGNGAAYDDRGTAGASYNASTKSTTVKVPYMGSYTLNNAKLTAPTQGTVTFQVNGGSAVSSITAKKTFKAWEKTVPFYGVYSDSLNKYAYASLEDGKKDVLTATWKDTAITLPSPTKSGSVFGGWYADSACTIPVGGGGAPYTPTGNVTLYAKWSKLVLNSVTDLSVDGWKGGVDLTWSQEEANLFYKLYQKKEGGGWKQLFSATDIGTGSGWSSGNKIEKSTPGTYSFTINSTGFYNLYAYGARGSNYGDKKGGLGGYVSGKFWLTKGDTITYTVGSTTQGGSGTTGGNGASGGGATTVTSGKLGVLLVGGGGGGANFYQGGGAGGLSTGVSASTKEGAAGCGGGGDGYNGASGGGGLGGSVNYHAHANSCYHYHAGDTISGGACYRLDGCGGTYEFTSKGPVTGTYKNYPGGDLWDTVNNYCRQCAKNPCQGGHPVYGPDVYTCNRCGKTRSYAGSCGEQKWVLSCGREQGQVICGLTTATIVSANPAYGGASYINNKAVTKTETPGARDGNGYFKIEVDTIGCFDSLRLDNVPAHDEAKPNAVDAGTVVIEAADGTNLKVSFEKPEDNGTVYYHYAESYRNSNRNTVLSTTKTSPTYNLITEGVWSYYYVLDTSASTTVTAANKQLTSSTPAVKVAASTNTVQYLHIAPVDRAGNIGATTHVKIEPSDIEWNIVTGQVKISSTVKGTDYDGIHPNGTNSYFVRADGRTPFELKYQSYVQGTAADDYQIDHQQFEVSSSGLANEVFETVLPLSSASVAGTVVLDNTLFERSVYGSDILRDVGYSTASRKTKATINDFAQAFVGNPAMSGKTIVVVPHAGAAYVNADGQDAVKMSDSTKDAANKLTLVLDGEGPVISGTGPIEGVTDLDLSADIEMDIVASDDLSGLKDIKVTIHNLDDGTRKTYTQGGDGHVRFTITRSNALYNGSFRVEITATDNVGNETVVKYVVTGFALFARLERILEPHDPIFKCGESGVLTVETYGYTERLEVIFPEEMTGLQPGLNQTFDYCGRESYLQAETVQFMVPLYTPANTQYTITVRAYKGDDHIEEHPTFSTIGVEGSVLSELRTRLR